MNALVKIIASGLGSGYAPIASGTSGSLAAALVFWYLIPDNPLILLIVILAAAAVAVPVSTRAEVLYGKKDDGHIVIDEWVGMWISVLGMPHQLRPVALAFVGFRVLDVVKPFFVRRSQNLPGGWGVVADDVLAGILVNLLLRGAMLVVQGR